ncbi:MAG: hypothetical protein A3K68_05425 [Euryarchaeota archaeon RBG_16_68_13]|nr:MAG: hypothetical protein A3K68_05425 [Euryarchaeota archaeon RBG_16_68_13]
MARLPRPAMDWRATFLLAFALGLVLLLLRTWQLAFLAGFVAGMIAPRASRAFLLGGTAVAFAWAGYLVYLFDFTPAGQASGLLVEILGLGAGLWWLPPLLSVGLGFLVGATGGLTGHFGARLFLWTEGPETAAPPKA